jgi:hypothetical protein
MFNVDVSVPARVRVLDTVRVLEVVPPAIVNPVAAAVNVSPLTDVGVIAPSVRVIAGVLVAVATVPLTPLAVVTDTEVTDPPPPGVVQVPSARRKLVVPPPDAGARPLRVLENTSNRAVAWVALRSSTFPVAAVVLPLNVAVATWASMALVTLLAPMAVVIAVVPVPEISPERVIDWLAVR